MSDLDHALTGLRQALDAPRRHQVWRWLVRERMAGVRVALLDEGTGRSDVALAARQERLARERRSLLERLSAFGPAVSGDPDVEDVRSDLHRLVVDIEHHRQRTHDLVYDTVSLELGGSE